jgi:glycosyltransferase involved in cell wall biosynthesis
MRILYCAIDQTVPGTKGGSTHVHAVAEGLAARGHELHVAARPGARGFPHDRSTRGEPGSVHWHAIAAPFDRPQLRLLRAAAVRGLARAVRPDVVIERYHNFGGEGLLAARHGGARTLLEVNAPVIDYPGSLKQRLDRLLLVQPFRRWRDWQCRTADRIATPTRAILPDWVPAARVHETEWGADTDRFTPDATGPLPFTRDGRIVIVFVGAFRAWHGVHHLVRAMQRLEGQGRSEFHAVLIGDGPERARAMAAAEGLRSVTFVGPLAHDALPPCLAAADIGVAPFDPRAHAPLALTFYWSPLKVFEYMAAGLPVVAPNLPRLREILGTGEAGLLYDPSAPDALAAALASLADPTRRGSLGAAARARAVRQYSWTSHCEHLEAAFAAK